jgi:hypothetical protein
LGQGWTLGVQAPFSTAGFSKERSMSDNEMVCLATTSDPAEVRLWRDLLNAAGIENEIGEDLTVYIDNVPWIQADLWVPRSQVEKALGLLDAALSPQFS